MRKNPTRRSAPFVSENPPRTAEATALSYLRDEESPRSLRLALVAAAVAHALLLLVPLPRTEATVPEPDEKEYLVVPTPRFKPPEPTPEEPPRPPAVLVPVPDPDPTDPEPLRLHDTVETDLVLPPPEVITDFPDAPPEPATEPTGPYVIGGAVSAPVRLEAPMPVYPEIARRARRECTVILQSVIDVGGRVIDVEVAKECPLGLTEAALDAVARWRYRPATLGERAVPVYMRLQVDFHLD